MDVLQGRPARGHAEPGVRWTGTRAVARHHPARTQGRLTRGRPHHPPLGTGVRTPHVSLRRSRERSGHSDRSVRGGRTVARRAGRGRRGPAPRDRRGPPGFRTDRPGGADGGPVERGGVVEAPRLAIEEARRAAAATAAAGGDAGKGPPGSGGADEEIKQSPSGIVKMEDFASTLYFLDAEEVSYLRRETEREYATDLRRTVLTGLLDVFELQTDPSIRQEVTQNLDAQAREH